MLVLFETPAGYALFKLLDKGKLAEEKSIYKYFATAEEALKTVKLQAFCKFDDMQKGLAAATAQCDGTLDKSLKKFLKTEVPNPATSLAVVDAKLGGLIKDKLGLQCVADSSVLELIRGIRNQMDSLVPGLATNDLNAMRLGLSHSLCRYKLKFSPDKVDTMIVQAISLLDELDKEINTYSMRVREWYGWHFPELGKIIQDHQMFAKAVRKMGVRTKASTTDFSDILPEDVETAVKEAAEVSMGTEIAEEDIDNISQLCTQVVDISAYRASLYDYLHNRMNAIAPNLTVMVGELVGARLIAHAGSLMSLAKHPASTVQILGAEKALFRALKTKHDTPKYGLIYHASLVGQAKPQHKGKVSRILAAKTALSIRMDALGETEGVTIGTENFAKVEERLRLLESGVASSVSGKGRGKPEQRAHTPAAKVATYNASADVVMSAGDAEKPKKAKKAKAEAEVEAAPEAAPAKKRKTAAAEEEAAEEPVAEKPKKAKKSKVAVEEEPAAEEDAEAAAAEKKRRKKEKKAAAAAAAAAEEE